MHSSRTQEYPYLPNTRISVPPKHKNACTNMDEVIIKFNLALVKDKKVMAVFGKSLIEYKEGDLFSCPKDESMAHCVSEDLRMGKGIAVIFKNKFKQVEKLKIQKAETGQCAILNDEGRFIYYLVTKKKATGKPTFKSLQDSLEAMCKHCLENNVKKISMPKIGSGLDKLDWKKVKDIIETVFYGTGIHITVYVFKG